MPSTIDVFITSIEKRLENGEFEQALNDLGRLAAGSSADFQSEVSLHKSRFNRLSREYRRQQITREEYDRDLARLTKALLDFLTEFRQRAARDEIVDIVVAPDIELPENTGLEKIVGADNLQQINWLAKGLAQAKSVCRIITPSGKGTGFLIGEGVLMTNNHVLPSPEIAAQSLAEFNYELDENGQKLPSYRYHLAAEGFQTSKQYDYAVARITPNPELPALGEWGALTLNKNAMPLAGEHVTIIQHPQGSRKQIALTANQIVTANDSEPFHLHYVTDTMKGSSGSPIFNDEWDVIAIHHAYGGIKQDKQGNSREVNEGILISAIMADARGL